MLPSPLSFNASLEPSYGAHPSIITSIQVAPELISNSTCSLYLHFTLPPLLFVDKYELEMRAQDYEVIRVRGRGAKELEKPVHALPTIEGVADELGVEVIVKRDVQRNEDNVEVQLPIHVRYGEPIASQAEPYIVQVLEAPNVGLACESGLSSCQSTQVLPDYLKDIVLGSNSHASYCAATSSKNEPLKISIPLGNTLDLPTVEFGTSAVVLACFVWVAVEAWRTSCRLRATGRKAKND